MGGEVEHDEGLITQRLIRLDGSGLRDQLSAESEVHGVRKTPSLGKACKNSARFNVESVDSAQ